MFTGSTIIDKSAPDWNNVMMKENNHRDEVEAHPASKVEKEYYSCKVCGNPFSARAPDDVHRFSSVYQCWNFDWIERAYKCPNCSKTTTLYWHSKVHKYRDYATAEQVIQKMSNEKSDDTQNWARRMVGY
jgi:rubredoxin